MTPRKRRSRVYWRLRGGERRAYGDFRDYRDVGGSLEALIASGEKRATTDSDVAQALAAQRLRELDGLRRGRTLHGVVKSTTLAQAAQLHLIAKAESGRYTSEWLGRLEAYLRRVLGILGDDRDPSSVTVEHVRDLVASLRRLPSGRRLPDGRVATMGDGNVRHHLNALSGVFRRAASEGYVLPGL
jgi:hypothetical protein